MKSILTIFFVALTLTVFPQQTGSLDSNSNSFENNYRKLNPTLIYSYNSASKIHNYSNNWDFDNDGIKDELYFEGTGGAHLYYFLKVILSSDKKSREFNFAESDFPFLTATDTLNFDQTQFGFVVTAFSKNLTPSIVVRLDNQSYYDNKDALTKNGIKTKSIVISFENGKTKYGCL
jgi:hypothetical protein